jgi:hypothetical protein
MSTLSINGNNFLCSIPEENEISFVVPSVPKHRRLQVPEKIRIVEDNVPEKTMEDDDNKKIGKQESDGAKSVYLLAALAKYQIEC